MFAITLHHMRTGWARLAAAGLAIVLGTAFVAATLLAGQTMRNTAYQSFTAAYAGSDLVVTGHPLGDEQFERIAATDGVEAARPRTYVGMEVSARNRSEWVGIESAAPLPRMRTGTLESGEFPRADDQVAVSAGLASRLELSLGDRLDYLSPVDDTRHSATVVGITASATSFFDAGADLVLPADRFRQVVPADSFDSIAVALDPAAGPDLAGVQSDLTSELGPEVQVRTMTEFAQDTTAGLTGDADTFTTLLLAFAAVALAVAALVITNTFTVLVAQRTRLLALLRAIGATRWQVRRSVLTEAALLGVGASAVGIGLGIGVVELGARLLSPHLPGIDVAAAVGITPATIIAPLLTGLAVTFVACWLPARNATRVSPLAALRPLDGTRTAGRLRAGIALALVLIGAVMLVGGVLVATRSEPATGPEVGLLLGIPGGFISVFGILLGAVYVVPAVVRLLGRLGGGSVAGRIATENAIRNPRRTATTTNALVIGVALVAMMSTGAATGQRALEEELTSNFPVDLSAATVDQTLALTPDQRDAVTALEGIDALSFGRAEWIEAAADGADDAGPTLALTAPADARSVLQNPGDLAGLDDRTVLIGNTSARMLGLSAGDGLRLGGRDGIEVTVLVNSYDGASAIATPALMTEIAPEVPENVAWLALADGADPLEVGESLNEALARISETDPEAPLVAVEGSALERVSFAQVIDTLLAVVLGLLAVAVVIALVGVANTLALSVLERRRESAVLRAMGLTRGQLRAMLAVEGVLIAGVGTIIGLIAGIAYGWAGAAVMLGQLGHVSLVIPWGTVGAVVVVAVAAGLLASVLPARSAVRTSPVEALAEE
ncbi:ABC transporter permease [Pseudactinotalea sp. HY158]|uniref:ABC transporter permease n=1 Tax=Pseudactinotalea sp. HY158 TaxID=2654547 RepID=UPI00129CE997|nr:ABC transporter permease [Pseudactinotalea sp. HY158]QGH70240.1 FtsX-like permease family protein [Pseudactinotalea sp. HY158]